MEFDAVSEFKATLRFKKAFHTPVYFSNFPVSLVRITPVLETQYIFLENARKAFKSDIDRSRRDVSPFLEFIEFSAGLEAELLLYYNRSIILILPVNGLSIPIRWVPAGYSAFNPSIHFLIKIPN